MPKSIIKTVLDNDWAGLKKQVESKTALMIKSRIQEKKAGVLANLNGVTPEQMAEVLAISKDK